VSDVDHDTHEHLDTATRFESGISTVYRALDRLVAEHHLDDAALIVDVPVLGRQILRAGRRPLRDDDGGLLTKPPGLYVEPLPDPVRDHGAAEDPLVAELMMALAELGLRHDTANRRPEEEQPEEPA